MVPGIALGLRPETEGADRRPTEAGGTMPSTMTTAVFGESSSCWGVIPPALKLIWPTPRRSMYSIMWARMAGGMSLDPVPFRSTTRP